MRKFLVISVFVIGIFMIVACDGIVTSYHPKPESGRPIDGTFSNNSFNSRDVSYVRGNLQYLSDRTSRDNTLYFESIKKYDEMDYKTAKDYIDKYNKFLKVDIEQLDEILRKDQMNTAIEENRRKMENGTLPKYPIKNNVKIIQLLKKKRNKMAFPDYMNCYMNAYYAYNKIADNTDKPDEKLDNDHYSSIDKITDRDSYVEFYLGTMNAFSNSATQSYSERSLE